VVHQEGVQPPVRRGRIGCKENPFDLCKGVEGSR